MVSHHSTHYYYLLSFEFFTSALVNGFSLEFEWQQVSSSLQDSSQYFGRSQQCYSLDSLHSSSYFQVLQPLYQSFGDCTKCTNYNWYHHHFHVPQFFLFPSKVKVLIFLFTSFQFYSMVSQDSKIYNFASSLFFFCWLLPGLIIWLRSGDLFLSHNPREFMCFILQDRFWVVHIPLVHMVKFQFLAQFPVDYLAHSIMSSLILFLC